MKNLLMPRYRVRRVTDLKADELKRLGIKGLALDIDNTIAYDSVLTFIEGVPEWIQTMREGGIRLVIVSNALPARARKISEMAYRHLVCPQSRCPSDFGVRPGA